MKCYYAKLTEQNEVLTVIRYDVEDESAAISQLSIDQNWPNWKRCYKDNSSRGHCPSVGDIWNSELNIFVQSTKPYPSWVLNNTTGFYESPVAKPDMTGSPNLAVWNEDTQVWDILTPQ